MIRVLIFLGLFVSAAEAREVDRLVCREVDTATKPLLPSELRPWLRYSNALKACPVHNDKREFLWWIFVVDWPNVPFDALFDSSLYFADANGHRRRCGPLPYLVDGEGRELGRLSDAFPSGGEPGWTELTMSDWVDGFPRQIDIKVFNARVMGDYRAPTLRWNGNTEYYDWVGQGVCDMPPAHRRVSDPP